MKERAGLSEDAANRTAVKALDLGMRHEDASGRLRKYFDWLFLKEKQANNVRIYGQFVYLFRNEKLITVVPLPCEHKKSVKKFFDRQKDTA